MELTYKNAHRISSGITFIISIIWWSIFELFLSLDTNSFIICGTLALLGIFMFIIESVRDDEPERPNKFEVIITYLLGIILLVICLLFKFLYYLFVPLIFLSAALVFHFSFIALKKQGGKRIYQHNELEHVDCEKI